MCFTIVVTGLHKLIFIPFFKSHKSPSTLLSCSDCHAAACPEHWALRFPELLLELTLTSAGIHCLKHLQCFQPPQDPENSK